LKSVDIPGFCGISKVILRCAQNDNTLKPITIEPMNQTNQTFVSFFIT